MKNIVLGIVAHVDAGKTTLGEALLYTAGATRSLGRVDGGDSRLDFNELEKQRGITIYSKQAIIERSGMRFELVDTPGHVDFSAETERVFGVLDYALLVVDGAEGVQGHTLTLWNLLGEYGIPTFVFVNKMDRAFDTREDVCEMLRARLDVACLDFTDGAPLEACAMTDEAALDEYLDTGGLGAATLNGLVAKRLVFPCFFGSALKLEGIDELLDGMSQLAEQRRWPDEFAARVYKISHDEKGERLTWLKVTGGELRVKQLVEGQVLPTARASLPSSAPKGLWAAKVNQIRLYTGGKFELADRIEAGRVCAVTGLEQSWAGCLLGAQSGERRPPVLAPVMASAVELRGNDPRKVHAALRVLDDEDPQLGVVWDEDLQELRVNLMGEIQQEVLKATLAERFGFDVGFGPGGILYRETIAGPVVGIGHFEPLRHYAEAQLLLEPLPTGSGVLFGTQCRTDDLDLNWQRLILTNAMERPHRGVLVGAPITDLRITLVAGRAHLKHTEGGDFRQATYRAIRQGLMQARSVLLEPRYRFALRIPGGQVGRALADLQKMAAEAGAPMTDGLADAVRIGGVVPASEVQGYALSVAAYTHGQGSLSLRFAGYAPCHDADEVVARAAYDPEADLSHTPDSVFCSHGAGHTVKWNEVAPMAHATYDPSRATPWKSASEVL